MLIALEIAQARESDSRAFSAFKIVGDPERTRTADLCLDRAVC